MKTNTKKAKNLTWPFPGNSLRLAASKLTREQKNWLGAKINSKEFTAQELSFRFKLPSKTLCLYAHNLRKGVSNGGVGGSDQEVKGLAPSVRRCPICLDYDQPLYDLQCGQNHGCCSPCLYTFLCKKLFDTDADRIPHIPTCPCCSEALDHKVVEDFLKNYPFANGLLCTRSFSAEKHKVLTMMDRMHHLHENRSCRLAKHIRCPSCPKQDHLKVSWFNRENLPLKITPSSKESSKQAYDRQSKRYDPDELGRKYDVGKLFCCSCQQSFCSHCRATPYHYKITCAAYDKQTEAWRKWKQEDESSLLVEAMVLDNQLSEGEAEESLRQIKAVLNKQSQQLIQDEEYKTANCKLCPNCNRVVEKLSGCDAMICGQSYHGGDRQQGCGQAFRWNSAPPYQSTVISSSKTSSEIDHHQLQRRLHGKHMINGKTALCCDACHRPISGPRIHCLNCPSYDLCLKCTYAFSSSDKQDTVTIKKKPAVGEDHVHHDADHVCQVILASE